MAKRIGEGVPMNQSDPGNIDNSRMAVGRRLFVGGAAAAGLVVPLLGTGAMAQAAATPKRGGTLRLGMTGGGSTDSMDPARANAAVAAVNMLLVYNCLIELDREPKKTMPELAESWEARPGAKEWIFKIRSGVEFHNGKTLDADDIVYSLNRHIGPKSTSLAAGFFTNVTEVKSDGPNTVIVSLRDGDANFPAIVTFYGFAAVPKDFTDWAHPIGTGPYILKTFQPGARFTATRNPNYWKPDRAWFDEVEISVINDSTARLNALITGRIDAMNRVDRRTLKLLTGTTGVRAVRSPGGLHYTMCMDCRRPEFANNDARLALKYAVDREQFLNTILQGNGKLGNDHPISPTDPDCNSSLPQRVYDPDKAKFHLKKAGLDTLTVALSESGAAFAEADDAAALYAESAKKAGLVVNPVREPSDGYFANVWMKKPFFMSYESGEATTVTTLEMIYGSYSQSNECFYKNDKVDMLIREARPETDPKRRQELLWELQAILRDDSGRIVPVFADFLDAIGPKLRGVEPNSNRELDGQRLPERAWLA
jgi:peptide/nickel transport system substrate-binding protein